MKQKSAAIVDVGSNTIKVSVIALGRPYRCLYRSSKMARIVRGMTKQGGGAVLPQATIDAAVGVVRDLLKEVESYELEDVVLVGTSALRDASNAADFVGQLNRETGKELRILGGIEEAYYISKGVSIDPMLSDSQSNFSVIDLGGGSLECIDFGGGEVRQVVSLPLGAVRVTEQFIENPNEPIAYDIIDEIFQYAQEELIASEFDFSNLHLPLIGAGGAFVAARKILAVKEGIEPEYSQPIIQCEALAMMLSDIACKSLEERVEQVAGLERGRADILPGALAVILAAADLAKSKNYIHSYYNLPYGIAAELSEA